MAKTFKSLLSETLEDLSTLVQSYSELYRLKALEKGVPVAVKGGYITVLATVAVTFLLFLLLTVAFAFGLIFVDGEAFVVLKGLTLGFLCTSGMLLLIGAVLVALRDKVCGSITANIITKQLDELERQDQLEAVLDAAQDAEHRVTITNVDTDIEQLD